MAGYLFIASRDPIQTPDAERFLRLAAQTGAKESVTVLLVENGVFLARGAAGEKWLRDLRAAGVEVLADEHALRERGITRLASGVRSVSLLTAIDKLAEGVKAVWN